MDPLSMTPARRQYAHHAYGRTADAFETVAWRPPAAERLDPRVANDGDQSERSGSTLRAELAHLPVWLHIVGGGVIAALMGAMLGGALHV